METIADFVSKDEEIKRLNNQLSMVAKFYDEFHKDQIAKYKYKINELNRVNKRLQRRGDKYKDMPKALQNKASIRASELIILKAHGFCELTLEQIAEKCFTNISTVSRLNSRYRNEKCTNIINY